MKKIIILVIVTIMVMNMAAFTFTSDELLVDSNEEYELQSYGYNESHFVPHVMWIALNDHLCGCYVFGIYSSEHHTGLEFQVYYGHSPKWWCLLRPHYDGTEQWLFHDWLAYENY